MYEKEVDIPRLIASYRLQPPHGSVPPVLRDASRRVIDAVGASFNSIGLNRYRDGAKQPPRDTFHVDLEPGSLLVMSYTTQIHYTHGVPKVAQTVGERVSLAFCVKPAAAK